MKNSFDIEVNFSEVPLRPFEWDSVTLINDIKVQRVSSKTILDFLTYECILETDDKTLLLSDTKDTIVLRLDKDGKIKKRSFLLYSKDLDVCEYAFNIKKSTIDYKIGSKKLIYSTKLLEEENIKNFLIKYVSDTKDEEILRYLYYKCTKEVEGYSKEKLILNIEDNFDEKYLEIYEILLKNQDA